MKKNAKKIEAKSVEQDFLDAIERIKLGKPRNKELQVLEKQGRLRLNIVNVSKEAGHSRTLIGHDQCEYPNIRKLLVEQKAKKQNNPSIKIAQLKEEVLELKRKLQAVLDQNAILLALMTKK